MTTITTTTTPDGTTVTLVDDHGEELVIMSNADKTERVGRIYRQGADAGFQPVPSAAFALRPAALRAIADMIDGGR